MAEPGSGGAVQRFRRVVIFPPSGTFRPRRLVAEHASALEKTRCAF